MGEPFVGRCGKFLDQMLDEAGLVRDELYITNTVKCRPTKKNNNRVINRPPSKDEIEKCKVWLWKELTNLTPSVILTLGKVPTGTLLSGQLKKSFALGKLVGKKHTVDYMTAKIIPLYHPSYLMVHGKQHTEDCIKHLERIKREYA